MQTPSFAAARDDARAKVNELIAGCPFYQLGLMEIAALLPESDDELHEWLEETVAERDSFHFIYLICAAALAGRKLQATLLPGGTMLLGDENRFAWLAWHMEGDVTGNLIAALGAGAFSRQMEAMVLFVAIAWWQKNREGEVPRPLIATAR